MVLPFGPQPHFVNEKSEEAWEGKWQRWGQGLFLGFLALALVFNYCVVF